MLELQTPQSILAAAVSMRTAIGLEDAFQLVQVHVYQIRSVALLAQLCLADTLRQLLLQTMCWALLSCAIWDIVLHTIKSPGKGMS